MQQGERHEQAGLGVALSAALSQPTPRSAGGFLRPHAASRRNAKTVEVNASHVPYMSHPKEIAKLIEEAAAGAKQ